MLWLGVELLTIKDYKICVIILYVHTIFVIKFLKLYNFNNVIVDSVSF